MSKTITLNLNRSLINEAVKTDSFITGKMEQSEDAVKNAAKAFNEQAGNDVYHERKLLRTLRSAVAKFEANMAEFLDSAAGDINDTLALATEENPAFTITIVVNDRYNSGLAKPLSSLAEEYIINMMDFAWWQAIKPELAKNYLSSAQDTLAHIHLCFSKTAPEASDASYLDVTGEVTNN